MRRSRLVNANTQSRPPSEVIAHYLEAIYYIRAEGEVVRSARLADWLSVSRPTVTVALRRMTRDGMVRINARKEIELTARGDAAGAAIVRRHRIMERWLTDVLGLDWVTADAEAERLEHAGGGGDALSDAGTTEDLPPRQPDPRPFDDAGKRGPALGAQTGRCGDHHPDLGGGPAGSAAAVAVPPRPGTQAGDPHHGAGGRRDRPHDAASGGPPADAQQRDRLETLGCPVG
ncbi:MAG: metal-dependent transcriptional regulator [Chloroflexi bacterium]|nr:MAG: metal-dependent transcriptional regulator [Chloroflexota bacterium]